MTTYVDRDLMLNQDNFMDKALRFRDRQAGVSVIFDPTTEHYSYNAYCIETQLMTELFTCEYEDLDEALQVVNQEFATWDLFDLSEKKAGCSSCAAKH